MDGNITCIWPPSMGEAERQCKQVPLALVEEPQRKKQCGWMWILWLDMCGSHDGLEVDWMTESLRSQNIPETSQ